jgi:tRNA(fMet)-specific endonuclease VapC
LAATYLLDTNALVSILRKEPVTMRRALEASLRAKACVSFISVGELLGGVYATKSLARRQGEIRQVMELLTRRVGLILTIHAAIADHFGQIQADLRDRGCLIPHNDIWIAATALAHDLVLVSDDAHFARVPGLKVENWAEGPQV